MVARGNFRTGNVHGERPDLTGLKWPLAESFSVSRCCGAGGGGGRIAMSCDVSAASKHQTFDITGRECVGLAVRWTDGLMADIN